jgi:hypothetical protein
VEALDAFPCTEQALDRMDEWVKITQALANAAQAIGIIVGGAWVYFKFLRGRTFVRRAQVAIEATITVVDHKRLIKVKTTVTNAGLSRVPFREDFKWIEMSASTAAPDEGANVVWEPIMSSDVFTDQGWVESQEAISDETLFAVPESADEKWRAFHLKAVVWCTPWLGHPNGTKWVDNTIVLASTEPQTMRSEEESE